MLEQFLTFIQQHELLQPTDKVLLAVSGGIDSVCMAQLFHQSEYKFAIAHCNFNLRGNESDTDQQFVERLANQYSCKLHATSFNTVAYAKMNGISIQMAARDMRYAWFNELAEKNAYSKIALAHNLNDSTETMLLNLIRGTGLKGLAGISVKRENIIRPLLFARRCELEKYAQKNNLEFRNDSSNDETKYHRNLIRKEIIPRMEKINPSLHNTFQHEAEVFSGNYAALKQHIHKLQDELINEVDGTIHIDIKGIKKHRITPVILYELLEPYSFTYSDAKDILACINGEPGKQFYSGSYVLIKDRDSLVVEKIDNDPNYEEHLISGKTSTISTPINLTIGTEIFTPNFKIPTNNYHIALDADKIQFPLKLRHWKHGDHFQPLGMKGTKKLSDFFTDRKINLLDKKRIWLLTSNKQIVWVIGHQIDNRFKITTATKKVLILKVKN